MQLLFKHSGAARAAELHYMLLFLFLLSLLLLLLYLLTLFNTNS
jgi:hypothetical protein